MRVIIASRIFAPETAASAFRLGAVARALARAGHAVKVLTTVAPQAVTEVPPAAEQPHPGITVRRWPVLRDASGYVRGYLQYLSFDVPLLARLLLGRRPDAVLVEPPPTTGAVVRLAATLRRVPYVYYAADVWSDATVAMGAPSLVSGVVRLIERFALRGATHVIAVSDGVAGRIRLLAGHDRMTVVRGGVDTEIFSPKGLAIHAGCGATSTEAASGAASAADTSLAANAASAQLANTASEADSGVHANSATDAGSTGPIAVYAGTMSEWQGADVFVRALPAVLNRVPHARLIFAGHGSARTELEQLAASLGVTHAVTFVGVVPPEEAAQLLRSARVGLVSIKPGQGYDFAVPTKLFATAACGTPVLFAGVGAARDIVLDAALGSTPGYNTAAVADALTVSLSHEPAPNERAKLAEWARGNASLQAAARRAAHIVTSVGETGSGG